MILSELCQIENVNETLNKSNKIFKSAKKCKLPAVVCLSAVEILTSYLPLRERVV